MFSSEQWLANSGSNFYNGVATQSLRFDDGSSPKLTHTSSSHGNRKTFTISFWMKRANISIDQMRILNSNFSNDGTFDLYFEDTDEIVFRSRSTNTNGATFEWARKSQRKFRDVSAWYHIVIAVDVTVSSPSSPLDLFTFYLNGENITSNFTNVTNPERSVGTSNVDLYWNSTTEHEIGSSGYAGQYFDGYLAEFCNIDGLALAPSNFGELKNSAWIPVDTSGLTFGTNGFRLKFDQVGVGTASSSTIGADSSGKTNHYTSSGIVASDCAMPDSPELNWCTLNPLDNGGGGANTLSEGNLKAVGSGNTWKHTRSTFTIPDGSWYCEFVATSGIGNGNTFFGIIPQHDTLPTSFIGSTSTAWAYSSNSYWYNNNSAGGRGASGSGASWATGIVIGLTFDGSTLKFYRDNSLEITIGSIPSAEYAIGVALFASDAGVINFGADPTFAGVMDSSTSAKTPSNSGAGTADSEGNGKFFYAPPSGLALCTANLPEPTIGANSDTQADDHFNTALFTSDVVNPSGSQAPVVVGFKPDFIWTKNRNNVEGHYLADSNRGLGSSSLFLSSNTTAVDLDTDTEFHTTDTGFNIVDSNTASGEIYFNNGNAGTPRTYVAWNWKVNGGTTSSVSGGTNITNGTSGNATVQANTTSGISIVTFQNTIRSTDFCTFPHGLGTTPDMIMLKSRDSANYWAINHSAEGLKLGFLGGSLGDDAFVSSTFWNTINDTTVKFQSNGNLAGTNEDIIAYCLHSVEGYSKFGSYIGNGSATNGTFVYTGFAVKYLMTKRTNSAGGWIILDSARSPHNVRQNILSAQSSGADTDTTYIVVDFLSNGFKFRISGDPNTGNAPNIYMAFAQSPFKYATAQ